MIIIKLWQLCQGVNYFTQWLKLVARQPWLDFMPESKIGLLFHQNKLSIIMNNDFLEEEEYYMVDFL